ncbi:siderophore-interacting protein [Saxibacter everestensis]|uniref:Siderophore-interacting protein n=1 Tax=Saxibacter everestensis TaxID=2909229 RepID=A0ABY8QY73_9MICO|nr:siderophore-interacting protein [Brevibacteriaceae bacterium ZFBP1038]
MTMTDQHVQTPYRAFRVRVARTTRLSASFVRVTFTGDDVRLLRADAPDQRIKVVLPAAGQDRVEFDGGPGWYDAFKLSDPAHRPILRTYTIRAIRPDDDEVDVDFVLHGDSGPASGWVSGDPLGREIVLFAPTHEYSGEVGGFEWKPPAHAVDLLLAADETAVPAVAGILESLPADATGQVFLEVPDASDAIELHRPANVRVTWLPRGADTVAGAALVQAIRSAEIKTAASVAESDPSFQLDDIDVDRDILWEVTEDNDIPFYAWIAGEAGAVKAIRRHLVNDRGIERKTITFMGYWRLGKAEM